MHTNYKPAAHIDTEHRRLIYNVGYPNDRSTPADHCLLHTYFGGRTSLAWGSDTQRVHLPEACLFSQRWREEC